MLLHDFRATRPAHETPQARALEWLVDAHVATETGAPMRNRIEKLVARCACNASQIGARGHVLEQPNVTHSTTLERTLIYEREVARYFDGAWTDDDAPDDLIHVTCTGYVAPSGAQRLVAQREWPTRVTHAYHMGCYASIPALRIAAGCLATQPRGARCDVAHTEICTLHLDATEHDAEQIVVQSLFADGFIRYTASDDTRGPAFEVVGSSEKIAPESGDAMGWRVGDRGMQMRLAREVPKIAGAALRPFVVDLLERCGESIASLREAFVAVHPGGPRIIDGVKQSLELDERQIATSREVLFDYGNMSSATLPHVWMRMLADDAVPRGALVVSFAFGPGLTICGAVFRKR